MLTTQHTRRVRPAHLFATAAALLTLGFAASGAQAQTWTKTGTPGNLPLTGQYTLGSGVLTTITGSFRTTSTASTASNPDLFAIRIDGTSPFAFSATTIGFDTTIYDTQLFLFDSKGFGLYANDDTSDFAKGATLNPINPLAPGLYYLAVAPYGAIPRSIPVTTPVTPSTAAFDMFPNTFDDTTGDVGFTGLKTPKAGAGSLTTWSLSGADVETGTYSISLTGTTYAAPVPEASTWVSFGVPTLFVLGVLVRRRVKPAAAAASV